MCARDITSMRGIVNGKNTDDPRLKEALAWAGQQGHRTNLHVTHDGGDATRFASERSNAIGDAIVAGRDDGTVNEVLNGIMAARGASAPVPGTDRA